MRIAYIIVALGGLIGFSGAVRGQTAAASVLEGVVTLADSERSLLVIQSGEQAQAIKLDGNMPYVQAGERVRVEGQVTPYFSAFPEYPARPAGHKILPTFEAPTDWKDHFLARLRGFLRVPADGNYRFWITADEEGELLLGKNSDPASARLIASSPRGSWPLTWDQDPEQESTSIHLKAGERYYIEARQREWRGNDNLVVAWQSDTIERQVIGEQFLTPWRMEDGATNGMLYEFWTNCFITRLAVLSPEAKGAAMVAVNGARLEKLGPGQLPAARRVELGSRRSDPPNFAWVDVEGTVSFVGTDDGVLVLELEPATSRDAAAVARMQLRVLDWANRPVTHLANRKVRARGVYVATLDSERQPAGGILWLQDQRQLALLDFADTDVRGLEAVPMFQLTPANMSLAWGRKLLVRGTVIGYDPKSGAVKFRGDDSFHAYSSSDGETWNPVGVPVPVAMGDVIYAGLVASSMTSTGGTEAVFRQASRDFKPADGVGLGKVPVADRITFTNGTIALRPGGGDDWDVADQGLFMGQRLEAEGELVAQLQSFKSTHISDKAGLMMRESLRPDAPCIALVMTHGTRLDLLYRASRRSYAKAVDQEPSNLPLWLKLARRQHVLDAQLLAEEKLRIRQYVELVGLLKWDGGRPFLADAYVRSTRRPPQMPPAADETRESKIADLPSGTSESAQYLGENYLIRGVVTFMGRAFDRDWLFLQDESGAALIRASPAFFQTTEMEPGRLLEAKGDVLFSPGIAPFRLNTSAELGWAQLPPPTPYPDRADAKLAESSWVEMRGVVRSATNNVLRVMERNGPVTVWVGGLGATHSLARYVDCLVTVRGVFSTQVQPEPVLLVPLPRFIEVTELPPPDAFVIPSFAIGRVGATHVDLSLMHRTKVAGVVTYRDQNSLVVQDLTGGAQVVGDALGDVRVGDQVEVVGFPDTEAGAVTLRESVLRKVGEGQLPAPLEIMVEGLIDSRLNCWLVRIEGVLLDQKTRQERQILELQNGQRVFEAVLPESAGQFKTLPVGSRVEVTGVTRLQIASHSRDITGRRDDLLVASMNILMRTPGDLVLLERPPWWTWQHTAAVGAVLVVILIVGVGWIYSLRRRVARRTSELQVAMSSLKKETELSATLAERERLAAEIHDTLEQGLSGIMMQLDGADTRLANDASGARENLELARRMVQFSRAEVRHSLWNLESQLLKDGDLGAAIKEIARQMSAGSSTPVSVEVSESRFDLPAAIAHHLLRCTQEAISNALKHSGARSIQVKLGYCADNVALEIVDDGSGFESGRVLTSPGTHLGLRNLRSRARKMKGQMDISSEPHKGTTVRLTVPLTSRTEKTSVSAQ